MPKVSRSISGHAEVCFRRPGYASTMGEYVLRCLVGLVMSAVRHDLATAPSQPKSLTGLLPHMKCILHFTTPPPMLYDGVYMHSLSLSLSVNVVGTVGTFVSSLPFYTNYVVKIKLSRRRYRVPSVPVSVEDVRSYYLYRVLPGKYSLKKCANQNASVLTLITILSAKCTHFQLTRKYSLTILWVIL